MKLEFDDGANGELTCGIEFLTDFWEEKYLREYLRDGGSKIKFVTGREGSGKSHFLKLVTGMARREIGRAHV